MVSTNGTSSIAGKRLVVDWSSVLFASSESTVSSTYDGSSCARPFPFARSFDFDESAGPVDRAELECWTESGMTVLLDPLDWTGGGGIDAGEGS